MKKSILIRLFLTLGITAPALCAQEAAPSHLAAAEELVSRLDLANTNYEHGQGTIIWAATAESHTDCSGFIDHLLMHCYKYDAAAFKQWFGSSRPTAARYHEAIIEGKGFVRLQRVQDLRPGDLIAVKYLQRKDNTGHVMLVAGEPVRMTATKPLIEGTGQWSVVVIDSSESGHGAADTRHKRGAGGKDHDGLGKGVLRLYTTRQGEVAGFSWSILSHSEFKTPDSEHVVLGRLVPGYQP